LRFELVDYLGGATVDDRADRIDESRVAEISWRSRQRWHNVSSAEVSRLFPLVPEEAPVTSAVPLVGVVMSVLRLSPVVM
jgi:hypothetical protein